MPIIRRLHDRAPLGDPTVITSPASEAVAPEVRADLPIIPSAMPQAGIQLDIFTSYTQEELSEEKSLCRSPLGQGRDPRLRALFCEREGLVQMGAHETLSSLVLDYLDERSPAFQVRGARVSSSTDAAALFAALRSPYVERLSWMVTDRGNVHGSGILTIGSHCGTDCPIDPVDWREFLMAADGCEQPRLYIAHNHPSGNPEPSGADHQAYAHYERQAKRMGMDFTGLVLNGHRFAELYMDGCHSLKPYPHELPRPYEAVLSEEVAWKCKDPEEIAGFIKRIQTPTPVWIGLFCDAHMRIRSTCTYPDAPNGIRLMRDLGRLAADNLLLGCTSTVMLPEAAIATWPKQVKDVIMLTNSGWTSAVQDWKFFNVGKDL